MYLKKIEGNIFYPGNDQFTEHILYDKDSARFNKALEYGEEAETYVLKYLKKHYKQFEWYSCKQYCVNKLHIDYSNTFDTIFGDIIGLFDTGWAAIKINVKRTTIENKIATATHYGKETDIFNSDLRGFTFYLSTGEDVKDVSKWEFIWADCLVHYQPVLIKNKHIWTREQLDRYAVPFNKVMEIVIGRKDKGIKVKYDPSLLSELDSLYKTLNADKLNCNPIIGKPDESNNENVIEIPNGAKSVSTQNTLDRNRPNIKRINSDKEGFYATLSEIEIDEAAGMAKNGKDTLFYCHKKENGKILENDALRIWYSDIKDDVNNLYTQNKKGLLVIVSDKLRPYAVR